MARIPSDKRFWEHVMPEPNSGCWIWTASLDKRGYGQFNSHKIVKAHRFSYEMRHGLIPHNYGLDHKCRVRCCVNPDHLEPVTQRENTLRGEGPCAKHARKTHCPQGHAYAEHGVIVGVRERRCKICHAAGERNRQARRRAEQRNLTIRG